MSEENPRIITRRDLLRGAGIVAAASAAVSPAGILSGAGVEPADVAVDAAQRAAASAPARAALENLTAAEGDLLDTIVARLIPADALGPGAREAGAVRYIDRALGGALAGSRDAYRSGLAAFDRYCRTSRGKAFAELSPAEQDAVLMDVESGAATASAGFSGTSTQFFNLVLSHTKQGMFGDPYYGGNGNFAGWDLLGYPGVRTNVSAADQQAMERNELKPNHRSAYDNQMFNKAQARAQSHGGMIHAD